MEENRILDSIRKKELQLNSFEIFNYYKVPLLFILISLIAQTKGFQNFAAFNLSETTSKFGLIFLVLGITSFLIKLSRLKLISVEFSNPNVLENILNLAIERNWEITFNNGNLIILITIPIKGYNDYVIYNRNEGEKIFVFLNGDKILLRSIDNLDNFAIKFQNGENSANEKAILNRIKQTDRSDMTNFHREPRRDASTWS